MTDPSAPPPSGPAYPAPPGTGVPGTGTPGTREPGIARTDVVGLIALVCAIFAVALAFMGPVAFISWPFALGGLVLGIIGVIKAAGRGRIMGVVALVASLVAIVISFVVMATSWGDWDGANSNSAGPSILDADGEDSDTDGRGVPDSPLPMDTKWGYERARWSDPGTQWEGQFSGVVELEYRYAEDDPGAMCYAVIGVITPTSIKDDAYVADGYDTPRVELLVDSAVQSKSSGCMDDALVAEGYGKLVDADVAMGVEYKFAEPFLVPSHAEGEPEYVTLGPASTASSLYFEPEIVELD